MLVHTWMLIWKNFVSMDLRFRDSRISCFRSEKVFDKCNQFSHNKGMKFCVVSYFESLDLRCKMKVMSRDRVLGLDNGFEWQNEKNGSEHQNEKNGLDA